MDGFFGFVALDGTLKDMLVVRNAGNTPVDADSAPSYRIYGPDGLMPSGTGNLTTFKNQGNVTGATNASPIVIASVGHGLSTGTLVTITGVGGNTNANTTAKITVVDPNSFSLDGVNGNAPYTSGGVWHVTGVYDVTITPTIGNGYDTGINYWILYEFTVGGTVKGEIHNFGVV